MSNLYPNENRRTVRVHAIAKSKGDRRKTVDEKRIVNVSTDDQILIQWHLIRLKKDVFRQLFLAPKDLRDLSERFLCLETKPLV